MSLAKKVPLFCLSLVFSFILWAYVSSQQEGERVLPLGTFQARLRLENRPSDFFVVSEPEYVTIRADGTQEELMALTDAVQADPGLIAGRVNLKDASSGKRDYAIIWDLPDRFGVEWRRPRTVEITLERMITKEIPVEVDPVGSPPEGYVSENQVAFPAAVRLYGPETQLNEVRRARAIIELNRIRPGQDVTSQVEIFEANDKPASPTIQVTPRTVQILAALSPAAASTKALVTPTLIGQPAPGFRVLRVNVTPNQIVVSGPTDLIAALTTVETKPINITGIRADTRYSASLMLPAGTRQVSRESVTVEVVVAPTETAPPASPSPSPSPGGR